MIKQLLKTVIYLKLNFGNNQLGCSTVEIQNILLLFNFSSPPFESSDYIHQLFSKQSLIHLKTLYATFF